MKTLTKIFAIGAGGFLLLSAGLIQQTQQWVAPKDADVLKNPVKDNVAASAEGKKLYTVYCVVCHGEKGKGDGPAGVAISPKPADHSSPKFQAQTDGAIYWKITNGRPPMAAYKGTLTDIQRWQLVNYTREFGKATVKKK